MAHVYLLSEDDFDDQVYVYILEMLLAARVDVVPIRLRRGGGVGEVHKKLPLLLASIRRTGVLEDVYFVVAIDNDRALEHPAHERRPHRRDERCRHCALMATIRAHLPDGWPIPGAIAVPVEMIEAWLLMMYDSTAYAKESTLPVCGRRDQPAARLVYGASPPLQLKDLLAHERRQANCASKVGFALECVLRLDADDLVSRSPSFGRFREDVRKWRAG